MTLQVTQAVWLNEAAVCTIDHLVEVSGLSHDEIDDLVGNGLMEPADSTALPRLFHLRHVVTVRQAARLKEDFQLERNGLALAMTLLRRIDVLERALLDAPSLRTHGFGDDAGATEAR